MDINPDVERAEVTIKGQKFMVPLPFAEGHVLRQNEADTLNQTFCENIRNNFASKVEEASENGATPDMAKLQAELDAYVVDYDFGVRRSGGVRVVDPVEREAMKIAKERIRVALKKANKKATPEEMDVLAKQALEKYPQIRASAKTIVETRNSVAISELPDA